MTTPQSQALREGLLFGQVGGGADMSFIPRFYLPYLEIRDELGKRARRLSSFPPVSRDLIIKSVGDKDRAYDLRYLPLVGRVGAAIIALDQAGHPGVMIDVDPWASQKDPTEPAP